MPLLPRTLTDNKGGMLDHMKATDRTEPTHVPVVKHDPFSPTMGSPQFTHSEYSSAFGQQHVGSRYPFSEFLETHTPLLHNLLALAKLVKSFVILREML